MFILKERFTIYGIYCENPIENNTKNKQVKTIMMQVLKAKNSCRVKNE